MGETPSPLIFHHSFFEIPSSSPPFELVCLSVRLSQKIFGCRHNNNNNNNSIWNETKSKMDVEKGEVEEVEEEKRQEGDENGLAEEEEEVEEAPVPPEGEEKKKNNDNTTRKTKSSDQKQQKQTQTQKQIQKQKQLNPKFKDVKETGQWGEKVSTKERYWLIGAIIAWIICLVVVLIVVLLVVVKNNDDGNGNGNDDVTNAPTMMTTTTTTMAPVQGPSPEPTLAPTSIGQLELTSERILRFIFNNDFTFTFIEGEGDEEGDGNTLLPNLIENDVSFYKNLVSSYEQGIYNIYDIRNNDNNNEDEEEWLLTAQQLAMSWILYNDTYVNQFSISVPEIVERWAVVSIYYQFGGASNVGGSSTFLSSLWKRQMNWLSSHHHICSWEFLVCAQAPASMLVTEWNMPNNIQLPDADVADLEADSDSNTDTSIITDTSMIDPVLSYEIPNELALLSDLTTLRWNGNSISGTIPGILLSDGMMNLISIYLQNNMLTGTVPTELFENEIKQDNYVALLLQDNDLTGLWPVDVCMDPLTELFPIPIFGIDCDDICCISSCCEIGLDCYYDDDEQISACVMN